MQTLAEVMPSDLTLYVDDRAYKFKDIEVVKTYCSATDYSNFKRWPGVHKNVYFWVELANGYAVGWNESPSRGWSFPVKKLRK